MGIFGRISDIFKSNVNDMLDNAEEPEKMIKLMIIEMQESITKATAGLAQAMAQEKKMKREYDKYAKLSDNWKAKAGQALQAGNEDLARKALQKKAEVEQSSAQFREMYDSAATTTAKLKSQVDQLKNKFSEAKMKEATLIARNQAAKAQKNIAKQVGGFDSNSFAKFDKFEEKIMKAEAEAEAFTEIGEGTLGSLEDDFKALESNSMVDDELAKLKAELNQ